MGTQIKHLLFIGVGATIALGAFWGARQFDASPPESSGKRPEALSVVDSKVIGSSAGDSVDAVAPISTSASGVDGSSKRAAAEKARIAPIIDWSKHPGNLESQIGKAFEIGDGAMAIDLANKLGECDWAERHLKVQGSRSGDVGSSVAAQAELVKFTQEQQRIFSNCQTVVEGVREARLRLLDLAMKKGIFGAAAESFDLGVRRPDVLKGVVADANGGDLKGLLYVSAFKPSLFGIDQNTQAVARYALQRAADDTAVGKKILPYLDMAESLSVPMGGETKAKFDHSGLSAEAKDQAQVIAGKLIGKVSSGKGLR
jgi:hypothetical protein